MVSTPAPEMQHRLLVRVLVVLASLLAFLAIFTSWIDRQALDTDDWVDTSGRLLEDKEISDAIATYSVDQLYANVNVAQVLKKQLPPDLQPVSAPAAAGIRELATRAAKRAFQSERVQALWQDANRLAHTQLVNVLEDKSEAISRQDGKVVLDLEPIVLQLADRLGFKQQVTQAIQTGEETGRIQSDFSRLEIADEDNLKTAQSVTKVLQGLAWLFSIGSILLFAVAVYLARGRHWVVVLSYGLGLIASGLAAIALRGALKTPVVDMFAKTEEARTPAEHAWDISTQLLHSIASTVLILGILFVIASFLASPVNSAVSIRQALAPSFRERMGVVWSVFAAAALFTLIVWPPSGTRQLVITLLLIALAGAGVEALRRMTSREFPDAKRGDWMHGMRERARQASAAAGRRIGSAVRELSDGDRHPDDLRLDRLEKLGELKEKGVLSEEEFGEEKKRILAA